MTQRGEFTAPRVASIGRKVQSVARAGSTPSRRGPEKRALAVRDRARSVARNAACTLLSRLEETRGRGDEMRKIKLQAFGMLFGSCFLAGVAGAAVPAIPGEPPAGTSAALPSGPVPAPEPSPTAPPTDAGTSRSRAGRGATGKLLNIDVEGASAYVWRGINMFGADQNTQVFSLFPSLTAT